MSYVSLINNQSVFRAYDVCVKFIVCLRFSPCARTPSENGNDVSD